MEKPEMQGKVGIPILFLVTLRRQLTDENYMIPLYREPTNFHQRHYKRINERRNQQFFHSWHHHLKIPQEPMVNQKNTLSLKKVRRDLVKASAEAACLEEKKYFQVAEGCKDGTGKKIRRKVQS